MQPILVTTTMYHDPYSADQVRADQRLHEPVAMLPIQLLDWYLHQPAPFRRANVSRLVDVAMNVLAAWSEQVNHTVRPLTRDFLSTIQSGGPQ